jgi:hypothetical protein
MSMVPTKPKVVVHWVSPDGLWGVIEAGDFPADGTRARSKTRDTITDASTAPWDPALVIPVGAGSRSKFIKVKIADLPQDIGDAIDAIKKLKPANYARPGAKFIPEYPHICPTCGGRMIQLFTSQEHEGGAECPGRKGMKEEKKRKR